MPESEATLRSPEEIAHRLLAMFGVCVYSEVRGSGESWDGAQKYLNAVDKILNLGQNLTSEEKLYLAEKSPNQRDIAQFGWRYECCHVLMWALGIFDEIGFPNNICDVSRIAKIIWNTDSLESLLKSAKPRNLNEILDQADLMLRYNWACIDASINNRPAPTGLDGEVVHEWQYGLQWLIDNNEDCDDVSIST